MENRYKAIVSSKRLYREIELPPDSRALKVGTYKDCDVRFAKESFFSDFTITFELGKNGWILSCDNHIYFTLDSVLKLAYKELEHGDNFLLKYQGSNQEVCKLSFVLDFDYNNKRYDREIDIADIDQIFIGGTESCQIKIYDPLITSDRICLYKKDGKLHIAEEKSKYGTYVNGVRIQNASELNDHDFFSIIGFGFYYKYSKLYTSQTKDLHIKGLPCVDIHESKSQFQYPCYNRSTRVKSIIPTEKIPVLDPPQEPTKPKGNIVMQMFPILAMLGITVVLRGVMSDTGSSFIIFSICSMGIGLVTSTVSIVNERRRYKSDIVNRKQKYRQYISEKKNFIAECRREELEILSDTFYSVPRIMQIVNDFSSELFDREGTDQDFLSVRLGTGLRQSSRAVDYKAQERFQTQDELANLPEQLAYGFMQISGAPVIVDLLDCNAVGIVGNEAKLYQLMKIITSDLCVRHYYNDVRLFYVVDENNSHRISGLRLLPHLANEDLGIRNIVCDDESKNVLFEYLYREFSRRETNKVSAPNIIVFVLSDMGIKRHPISKFIANASSLGVTFIFLETYKELLPGGCDAVVALDENDTTGKLICTSDSTKVQEFSYDIIDDNTAVHIANRLAPVYCEEISLEGALTKNISLYELLGIISADDLDLPTRWNTSAVFKSMAAPLGVKTKNEVVNLDLNENHHGPHGLVAGTTGSGKSEILQSYILSMASLFHPYDVSFVIIDFKGGGMVNQFKSLPHLAGAITNIDGREINRSLRSIKAELKKRQALFAQSGVNHIDAYIKKYKQGEVSIPLPHLILIVDEFAELKVDQPEFMKELISAARIGRSLGVHLILATQKPSGVVDAQIWSNSKFKLCLKVQSKEDSNEVLKTPLAAEIREPGRAYLQVGNNEVFDLFQSAYSGAPANQDDSVSQSRFELYSVSLSGRRTPIYTKKSEKSDEHSVTQLEAIVEFITNHCVENQIAALPGICLPPLEECIGYPSAKKTQAQMQTIVPLGIYDDPDHQLQEQVSLDLLSGNTLVVGSSLYGKTSLLQVIIRGIADQYTPEDVNIYIMDFGSMALGVFEELCHVGGVVLAAEDEKLKNLIRLLCGEMLYRKEAFAKIGITSFASYREAGHKDLPHMVVLIDNFMAFRELYPDYDDSLLSLCREGPALGISIVFTSLQTSGIGYKYISNFSNRICLYCNQADEYSSVFDRCRIEPKNTPGRGLISIDKVVFEFQAYLAFDGEKEIDRVLAVKSYIQSVNKKHAHRAIQIPQVPKILDYGYVKTNQRSTKAIEYQVPVGIDYDTVDFVSIDLIKAGLIAITGREGYGKSNIVRLFMDYLQHSVFDLPAKAFLIDDFERQLHEYSSLGFVEKYTADANDFEIILADIEEELKARMEDVQKRGIDGLAHAPLLLVVVQNNNLLGSSDSSGNEADTIKRILKNYRQLKVCFVFADVDNVNVSYNSPELLKLCKEADHLLVCDDLANLKLMDLSSATLRQYKKPMELGDAYLITQKGIQKQKIIHAKEV